MGESLFLPPLWGCLQCPSACPVPVLQRRFWKPGWGEECGPGKPWIACAAWSSIIPTPRKLVSIRGAVSPPRRDPTSVFTARETEAPRGLGPGEWGPHVARPGSQRAGEPRKRRGWDSRWRGSQLLPGSLGSKEATAGQPALASLTGAWTPWVPWSGVDGGEKCKARRAEPGEPPGQ